MKSLSEYVQKPTIDLITASFKIKVLHDCVKRHRSDENFKVIMSRAHEIANDEGVSTDFQNIRVCRWQ